MTPTDRPVSEAQPPARTPCVSCPYRRDVPSGVWDTQEYQRLPLYDQDTYAQPTGVFLCHQQDGRVCAGWAGCHDPDHLLALRLGALLWGLPPETVQAIRDYQSPVPLFYSGQEACDHGMADVDNPGLEARRLIHQIITKRWRVNIRAQEDR